MIKLGPVQWFQLPKPNRLAVSYFVVLSVLSSCVYSDVFQWLCTLGGYYYSLLRATDSCLLFSLCCSRRCDFTIFSSLKGSCQWNCLFVCVCSFAHLQHQLLHSCFKLTATWKKRASFKSGTSIFVFSFFLAGPPFSNQNIPCVLLIRTAVKSADMSGGRPEVILPQDPTPVLGLWMPGFPLWAPPRFLALELGWGALREALHTAPQTELLMKVVLKSHSTLSQECCPSSASCCLIEKSEILEVKGYWVIVELCRSPSDTLRHFNILLLKRSLS